MKLETPAQSQDQFTSTLRLRRLYVRQEMKGRGGSGWEDNIACAMQTINFPAGSTRWSIISRQWEKA